MRLLIFLALFTIAAATPTKNGLGGKRSPGVMKNNTTISGGNGVNISSEIILKVKPEAANCSMAKFLDECRTADEAAQPVTDSFNDFNITTLSEAAAVLSIMLFESDGFKFNINHFPEPGNPGQGTRNMMNYNFILKYAYDVLPKDQQMGLPTIGEIVSDDKKKDVLSKVLDDAHSFASAAWFYQTQCNDTIKQGVKNGTQEGWAQYITSCVVTDATDPNRVDVWNKTLLALSGQ